MMPVVLRRRILYLPPRSTRWPRLDQRRPEGGATCTTRSTPRSLLPFISCTTMSAGYIRPCVVRPQWEQRCPTAFGAWKRLSLYWTGRIGLVPSRDCLFLRIEHQGLLAVAQDKEFGQRWTLAQLEMSHCQQAFRGHFTFHTGV